MQSLKKHVDSPLPEFSEKEGSNCNARNSVDSNQCDVTRVAQVPAWVKAMLGASADEYFFRPCASHEDTKKNEVTLFCTTCSDALCCQHCLTSHQGHNLIQIRRYVYQDVIRTVDINPIIDVASVQAYIINQAKVVFLNTRHQSNAPIATTYAMDGCRTCSRSLRGGFLYCCLACKVQAIEKGLDVTAGSSSAPTLQPYIPGPTKFGSTYFCNPKKGHAIGIGGSQKETAATPRNKSLLPAAAGEQAAAEACEGSNEPGTSDSMTAPRGGSSEEGSGVGDHKQCSERSGSPAPKRDRQEDPVAHAMGQKARKGNARPRSAGDKLKKGPTNQDDSLHNAGFVNEFMGGQNLMMHGLTFPQGQTAGGFEIFNFPMLSSLTDASLSHPFFLLMHNNACLMFPSAVQMQFPIYSGAWSLPSDLSSLLAKPPSASPAALGGLCPGQGGGGASTGAAIPGFVGVGERSSGSSHSEGGPCPVILKGLPSWQSQLGGSTPEGSEGGSFEGGPVVLQQEKPLILKAVCQKNVNRRKGLPKRSAA